MKNKGKLRNCHRSEENSGDTMTKHNIVFQTGFQKRKKLIKSMKSESIW